MNFIKRAYEAVSGNRSKSNVNLSASAAQPGQPIKEGRYLEHDLKSIWQTRQDIKSWRAAESLYYNQNPQTWKLQLLLNDIMKDALLTSQKENRLQQVFSADIQLINPDGSVDEAQSIALKNMPLYRFLTRQASEAIYREYSVVELSTAQTVEGKTFLVGDEVPRENVVPTTGMFYPDYFAQINGTSYRDMPEYGIWILEFWTKQMPLLNKAVPHVLFKRFAQSCWSELCEIYGIPPRVLKTNTQDKGMMNRAKKMMTDMGAASWFIIDEDESFEFAEAVTTNGDVYNNLINLCSNEICLLIVGAILAQDTKNGSRSKDQVAQEMLKILVESDKAYLSEQWNNIILPALKMHDYIKGDVTFKYVPVEDVQQLFERAMQLLQYYDVDIEWLKTKFGVLITDKKATPQPLKGDGSSGNSNNDQNLFDKGDKDFFRKARQRKSA